MKKWFSIEKYMNGLIEKKIITFLGLKLKLTSKKKALYSLLDKIEKVDFQGLEDLVLFQNYNLINLLTFNFLTDSDLLYLRTDRSLIIFSKRALLADSEFIKGFLFNHIGSRLPFRLGTLEKNSSLYREHKDFIEGEKIICKYANKVELGAVARSIVSSDENGKLFLEQGWLGLENCHYSHLVLNNLPKRGVLMGRSAEDYLKELSEKEQIEFLKNLFNWLFAHEIKDDTSKINGNFWDCHANNFFIKQDEIHFFDKEIGFCEGIDKWRCIYYFFQYSSLPNNQILKEFFLKHYHFEQYSEKDFAAYEFKLFSHDAKAIREAVSLNKGLFDKYFSLL